MLLDELQEIQRHFKRLAAKTDTGPEELRLLQVGNERIGQLLEEATGQLGGWKEQVMARDDLQRLLAGVLLPNQRAKAMWWQEQLHFYEALSSEIQAYFQEEDDAYLSVSLTALELLLIVRLCIEEGVVAAESLQVVFGFLVRYTGTARQGRLSFDSLKKRYSLRHEGARKKVKQLLLNMVKRIDRPSTDE